MSGAVGPAGVRGLVVATKRHNGRGAKGAREVDACNLNRRKDTRRQWA